MADNETHEEVVKLARRELEGHERINCWFRPEFVRALIDRLEAAHKRELSKICPKDRGDFGQLGDAAKLREALIKARSAICHFARYQCQSLSWENSNIQANCGDVLCSWRGLCEAKTAINAALAEPVKNCEVGTAMEQGERFSAYCRAHKHPKSECLPCPLFGQTGGHCELAWAQMPYAEQEGGDK